MFKPASRTRWASAASDIGRIRSITGTTFFALTNGHTLSRTAATMAAFSGTGWARSVVAWMLPRLTCRTPRSTSARLPPWRPMMTSRPPVARALTRVLT